jgi:hypothetical protein
MQGWATPSRKQEEYIMRWTRLWLAALAALLALPAFSAPQALYDSLLGEDWYGVYLNGKKAGYARNQMVKNPDGGYTISEDARFLVSMAGAKQDMHIATERTYGADGALTALRSQVESFGETTVFEGVVQGEKLVLKSTVGNSTREDTLPRPKETLDDAVKYSAWIMKDPTIGDNLTFSIFEPMYGKELSGSSKLADVELRRLNNVPTRVYHIETTFELVGLTTTSYVAEDGTVLEDVIAGNMTMRLEPEQVAKDVDYSNDVIVSNAAMLPAPIPNARDRESLRMRLSGPLEKVTLPSDASQKVVQLPGEAVLLETRHSSAKGFEHAQLPVTSPEHAEWLKPTTYVQSDDPRVLAKAKEIVGDETNAWKAAEKLCRWVDDNMKSKYSAQLTNTLNVLETLEGDCTEHSILFVGLARAAGIPAREVAGLIYVEEGDRAGFFFHQWAKVWVGEWVDVDPAFGQPEADATHIKLGEGDLIEQAKLLPLIGQLKIEVLPEGAQAEAFAQPQP